MADYIYETRQVNRGRSMKSCSACGSSIDKGESSITVTVFHDEFMAETVCNDECYKKFEENFKEQYGDE